MKRADEHGLQFRWGLLNRAFMSTLLSVSEAAARSGLSARVIHRAIQSGELPVQQIEGRTGWEYRIKAPDLDSFAKTQAAAVGASVPPRTQGVGARYDWRLLGLILVLLLVSGILIAYALSLPSPGSVSPPARPTPPATGRHGHTCAGSHNSRKGVNCGGGTGAPSAGAKSGGATTGTSFTVVMGKRGSPRSVVIQGNIALRSGLTTTMKAVYWGCGAHVPVEPSAAGPATLSSVSISSTLPLSPGTKQRLKQWAATFGASLNTDDPPLIGIAVVDESEDLGQEGASLWAQLRRILGPSYAIVHFSEQRHSDLHAGSGTPCSPGHASSGSVVAGLGQAAQTDLRHWLATIRDQASSCAGTYGSLAAQLGGMLSGEVNPGALDAAVARESRFCRRVVIPPLPRSLTANRAARDAYHAVLKATLFGRDVAPMLSNITAGNTNAPEIQSVISQLHDAMRMYQIYAGLSATLKRG